MDFHLSESQQLLRDQVAAFVDKEVVPVAAEIDARGEFPRELFRRIGDLGYLALRYPEEMGGGDAGLTTYCLFIEEIARGSMSLAASVAMQSMMGTHFVHLLGTAEQQERLLQPALRGEKMGTFALTEPGAGSDLGGMRTTAVREGDGWRLRGSKIWITNAAFADFFTVAALTTPEKKLEGMSLFLVEKGVPGFSVGREIEKLGTRGSGTSELAFDDCRLPADALLGEQDRGFSYVRTILNEIRVMTGALSLGLARVALADGVRYANERQQFGRPIAKFQAVSHMLAQSAAELEAARHLVYHAAWRVDEGLPCGKEAAMAKLIASEMANRVADQVSRVFASYGFAMDYPAQRYLRDARFLLSGGGTSEILRNLIARDIGL